MKKMVCLKKIEFFSFFFSGLFTQETTAEALQDYRTAQDSVTLFLKVFVLYSPLVSINASKCYWVSICLLNI